MSWRAAIDIGSVSAKILLTDGSNRVRAGVDTLLGGARLAVNGEVAGEQITDAGLARLEGALDRFRELLERHQPSELRVVATAPGRWAANDGALAELVDRVLRVPLEVVSGVDEARLAYLGVRSDPALAAAVGSSGDGGIGVRVVTVDIGGASTDLAAGWSADGPDQVYSIPVGGRSLSAAYLESDPPRADELSSALSIVELHLDDVQRDEPALLAALDDAVVVGCGAVVTLAAVELGLAGDDPNQGNGDGPLHGFVLTREAAEDVFRTIATESREDRRHNPGLPATRVDDIVGAGAVLVELMRQVNLNRLVVSQRGLLDGVLARSRV